MSKEIERKFLVNTDSNWMVDIVGKSKLIYQGYLAPNVRIRTMNDIAYITIKEKTDNPQIRNEFEYEIPFNDAKEMLILMRNKGKHLIQKTRYTLKDGWTIDRFHEKHAGLELAEIEIKEGEAWPEIPSWADKEVTEMKEYTNAYLFEHGFNLRQHELLLDALHIYKLSHGCVQ